MKVLSTAAFQKTIGTGPSTSYTSTRLIPTAPQTPHETTAVRAALIGKLMLQQTGIRGSALNQAVRAPESSTASKSSRQLSWIVAFCFS